MVRGAHNPKVRGSNPLPATIFSCQFMGQANIQFLSFDDIMLIHRKVIEHASVDGDPVTPPGLKNHSNLLSAIDRQTTGFDGHIKYPEARLNAASLMYGLCLGHAFHNGNKRTALLAGLLHLEKNGYCFDDGIKHRQIYLLMKGMAGHDWSSVPMLPRLKKKYSNLISTDSIGRPNMDQEVALISDWLHATTRTLDRNERVLSMRVLRAKLNRLGVKSEVTKGSSISFTRRLRWYTFGVTDLTHVLPYQGDGRDVAKSQIKRLRQALHLSHEHGCDAVSFYDTGTTVEQIMVDHRNLISQLAKT